MNRLDAIAAMAADLGNAITQYGGHVRRIGAEIVQQLNLALVGPDCSPVAFPIPTEGIWDFSVDYGVDAFSGFESTRYGEIRMGISVQINPEQAFRVIPTFSWLAPDQIQVKFQDEKFLVTVGKAELLTPQFQLIANAICTGLERYFRSSLAGEDSANRPMGFQISQR